MQQCRESKTMTKRRSVFFNGEHNHTLALVPIFREAATVRRDGTVEFLLALNLTEADDIDGLIRGAAADKG